MRFRRCAPSVAVCAAGFFTGVLYDKFKSHRQFTVLSIDSDDDIEEINQKLRTIKSTPCMKLGFPSYDNLVRHGDYVLSYNKIYKNANWVMERLTSANITVEDGKRTTRNHKFYEDKTLPELFRARDLDYKKSGFDRGHLANSNYYKHSQKSRDATFVFSNVVPQNHHLNMRMWHSLEEHVQKLIPQNKSVYVCTGPLYLPRTFDPEKRKLFEEVIRDDSYKKERKGEDESPKKYVIYEVIGENSIAVPTHLFKAIAVEVEEGVYEKEAYKIPNERLRNSNLSDYKTSIEEIEKASGLSIFDETKRIRKGSKEDKEVKGSVKDKENDEDKKFYGGRSL